MSKMTEDEVLRALDTQISVSTAFINEVGSERALAYEYYHGKPYGNEIEGRSRVISQDVAQVIDSALPALVKIFVSGDKAVEFTPRGPEDVQMAENATIGCNYVFFSQNNGYAIAHDAIKDGLLQKTGVLKWDWDTSTKVTEKNYQGLDDTQMQMIDQDPSLEIIAHEAVPQEGQQPMQEGAEQQPPPMLHNVTIRQKKEAGQLEIFVVPPEEVLISPESMSMDVYKHPFICHAPYKSASDLREMGIEQSVIDELTEGENNLSEERIARQDRISFSTLSVETDSAADLSMRMFRYYECYIRLDEDGDGIAELRKICKVGSKILSDDVTDHIPMCIWTPKVMPHEVIGVSLADEVMDNQLAKSMLLRGIMDSINFSIAPRMYVNMDSQVELDDVLTVRSGAVIRGNGPANNALFPIVTPFVGKEAFQVIEYIDQENEVRTGISRLFQGIDPKAINKTATGVNALISQATARVELIARNAAEYLFKPLFKGILYMLAKHQQTEMMIRVNSEYTSIDPSTWNKEYDMTCNVGLGNGTKDQQLMHLQAIGQDLAMIGQSPFGQQLIDAKKIYNFTSKKIQLAGFRDATTFINDPDKQPPPPEPGPPPEIQAMQMKIEAEQQAKQMEMQSKAQQAQADMQMEAQAKQAEMMAQAQQAQIEAATQIEIAKMKAIIDQQTKIAIAQINARAQAEAQANAPQEAALENS